MTSEDACIRCGGGIDNDHPKMCSACLYELKTHRVYEDDVNDGSYERICKAYNIRQSRTIS